MNYWEYKTEPTQYTDDVYFIGSNPAPTYLIKSTDGLILLDTGLPKTLYLLLENLRKIGCDYRDIKHIIHSHGHIDHIGSTRALVELTGAKTYIGEGDEDTVRGADELQYTNEFNMPFEEPFEPDYVVHDNEELTIGDKKFLFISCPGHTRGTMSIFFKTTYKGREYLAGMFGGGGFNTMSKEYLNKYGLPLTLRDDFINSLKRVYDYKVEVHLGNHLDDNLHDIKLAKMDGKNNPFIDTTTWKMYLDKKLSDGKKFFENDK